MNKKTEKKEKIKKSVLWTRILCIVLALLMVSGGIFMVLETILH